MLSSANQYLRPDYLSPLPTTLDAKKSPLALLAQTCSNIGADNPNNKPIISGLEKRKTTIMTPKKDKSPLIISDDHSNSKPSFKPYESVIKKTIILAPNSVVRRHLILKGQFSIYVKSCVSPAASTGSCDTTSTTLCSTQNTLSGLGYGSSTSLGLDLARSEASKDSLTCANLNAYKALSGINPLSNCCAPVPGHSIDVHGYQGVAQSGLLKGSNYPLTLTPYFGYARVKTSTGGTTLVPVCRDPYCTNCQLSMHSAQIPPCPSGCTQCSHDRLGLGHGLVPGLTGSAAAMAAVAAAGRVPGLSYPSVLPRPNICSWVVGDTFCGKTFNTSEELLQHLRTHTNIPTSESSLSLMSPSYGLNAACGMPFSSPLDLEEHILQV
ncbi:zinc finger protein Noc [Caerostris extrusa]|uniref:Zinc finger protein Noc n=1 Tax=Caerostris extrusa TaxID=172846 RepID=A0AAV4SEU6_CAEEX|nr:zinc finger protein Noc [Caerostris extrusa]